MHNLLAPLVPHVRWLIALGMALAGPIIHAQGGWLVQVGAYSEAPNARELYALQNHGPVVSSINARGLTVLSIGPFADRAAAQATLAGVQAVVPDAYIRRAVGIAQSSVAEQRGVAPVAVANAGSNAAALLNQLPADDRRNVVMLDGQLHYKDGDRFTPLAEYLSKR